MKYQKSVFQNHLIAAMTSGIKHTGASYQIPESLANEYARLCYNTAIKDVIDYLYELGKQSKKELIAQDFADAIQLLHIKQEEL